MNKKIVVLPLAALSLSVLMSCNPGGNNPVAPTLEEEIDNALKLPDNINGITITEARKITESAKVNFAKLNGIKSKNYTKNQFSKVYTGSYAKIIKDSLVTYDIESKHYVNADGTNPVLTINTKKHDEESEGGVTNTYDANRVDTVYIKENKAFDNVKTYVPTSYGSDPIIGQVDITEKVDAAGTGTLLEDFATYVSKNELLKLGNNNNVSDLGYFFQSGNDAYCIKISNTISKIKNNFDLTKSINVTTSSKTVMHFIKENEGWKSSTYATITNKYFDRDLNDKIFDTPVLVNTEKYYSQALYGDKAAYSETIEDPTNKLGTSVIYAYLPGEDAITEESIKDTANSYVLRDVSTYARSISGGSDYYFTVVTGENDVSPTTPDSANTNKNATSVVDAVTPDKFSPSDAVHFLNELYNDSYITQKNSNLEYTTCVLSPERRYDFRVSFAEKGLIEFDSEATHKIPSGWKFENGVLEKDPDSKEAVEGNYYVTIKVPQVDGVIKTNKCVLKVEFKNEVKNQLEQSAYKVQLSKNDDQKDNYKYQIVTNYYDETHTLTKQDITEAKALEEDKTFTLFNNDTHVQTIRLTPVDGKFIRQQGVSIEDGKVIREGGSQHTGVVTIAPTEGSTFVKARVDDVDNKSNIFNLVYCWRGGTTTERPTIQSLEGNKVLVHNKGQGTDNDHVFVDIKKDANLDYGPRVQLYMYNYLGNDINKIGLSLYYGTEGSGRYYDENKGKDENGTFGLNYTHIYTNFATEKASSKNEEIYVCIKVIG